jgi:AraC-like DNA-binding protein
MKENIEKHLTLQDIADYLGYSPSYFSMLFKKKTGHSPLAYLNLLKIQQACLLLDTTDMKINQISYKVGIEDAYYFSRFFSKTMGISPKEYRELKKG